MKSFQIFLEIEKFSNLSKTLFGLSGNLTQWNLSQDGDLLEFESISYFDLIWGFSGSSIICFVISKKVNEKFSNLSKTLFGLSGNLTKWNLSQGGDLLEFESVSYFDLIIWIF